MRYFFLVGFLISFFLFPVFSEEVATIPSSESTLTEQVEGAKATSDNIQDDLFDRPNEKKSPDFKKLFIKTVLMLIVFIGLLLSGSYILKKISGGRINSFGNQGAIRLVERKQLAPKSSLWLVEIEGEKYVVLDTNAGCAIEHHGKEKGEAS